jgi:DUF4097 and DUF4098 domain-containing protein YvlB
MKSLFPILAGLVLGGCVVLDGAIRWRSVSGVDEEARREETHGLELALGERLSLDTPFGDIEVVAAEGGGSELRAVLRAQGRTVEEAEAVLARYEVSIERGAGGTAVRLRGEPLRIDENGMQMELPATVDYVATVPAGTVLEANSGTGNLRASGALGRCDLTTSYGNVQLSGARGDVAAASGTGDLSMADLASSRIELKSSYGAIRVKDVRSERLLCTTGTGDIGMESVQASSLELDTDYGVVQVRSSAGDVRARTGTGDIRFQAFEGGVSASSSYGCIEIGGVLRALQASTGTGNVEVRASEGSRIDSSWSAASTYGDVVLRVPAGFGCALDASTTYGRASCDLPVTDGGPEKSGRSVRGTVGKGGPRMTLSSGNGDVSLKKL